MFCTRESNYRLNRVHERALRIISEDYISSFCDLVKLLNEKTIHQRCINFLMTEFFKYLNGLSPDLINEVFRLKSNYHNLSTNSKNTFQKLSFQKSIVAASTARDKKVYVVNTI